MYCLCIIVQSIKGFFFKIIIIEQNNNIIYVNIYYVRHKGNEETDVQLGELKYRKGKN